MQSSYSVGYSAFIFFCLFVFFIQSLQDELEKQENSLQKFGSVTNQLLKECHPPVTEVLTDTLKDVNMRYENCFWVEK